MNTGGCSFLQKQIFVLVTIAFFSFSFFFFSFFFLSETKSPTHHCILVGVRGADHPKIIKYACKRAQLFGDFKSATFYFIFLIKKSASPWTINLEIIDDQPPHCLFTIIIIIIIIIIISTMLILTFFYELMLILISYKSHHDYMKKSKTTKECLVE